MVNTVDEFHSHDKEDENCARVDGMLLLRISDRLKGQE